MDKGLKKEKKDYNDLKDVVVIFSVLVIIIVLASLFDLFDELNKLAQNPEGFKIVELFFVLFLFASAYAAFLRRRWKESNRQIKQRDKLLGELNDNVNRLRRTVDLSPDAITIHRDGQMLFINKAGVNLFGATTEEEVIGKHINELIHYAYVDKVNQRVELMTKYMKQVPVTDVIIKRLDGTYLDVSVASTPVHFHAIPHVITILRDITERKRNEEIQSQLASIVRHTTDAVYALSLDGMIQSWNPGARLLYQYSEKDAVGSHVSFIYPPDKMNEMKYLMDKINKDESVVGFETKRLKKDGSMIDVSITVSPIKEASGIITGASTIARDITYKKQVEAELRHYAEELALSNEELYVFSYAASHDLQEPLRTIQAFIQLLNEKHRKKLSTEVDELIDSAEDGVSRMYRLITDFLMYSRVGSQTAVIENVDCNIVLNDAIENLKIAIKESKARIKHFSLPIVKGNIVQITQVFQNLISNAIKYKGEKKPVIEISAEKKGAFWQFEVKDNGIGIEEWFSERIFIVFQKLHDYKKYPGSGIGLALCKRVIEKQGGKIWFESEVGKGTSFYFTLPVIVEKHSVKAKK
jgi:PAS domain S-box-containing protein